MVNNIDDLSYSDLPEPKPKSYSPWMPAIPKMANITDLQKTSKALLRQTSEAISNTHTFTHDLNDVKHGEAIRLHTTLSQLYDTIPRILEIIEKGE